MPLTAGDTNVGQSGIVPASLPSRLKFGETLSSVTKRRGDHLGKQTPLFQSGRSQRIGSWYRADLPGGQSGGDEFLPSSTDSATKDSVAPEDCRPGPIDWPAAERIPAQCHLAVSPGSLLSAGPTWIGLGVDGELAP